MGEFGERTLRVAAAREDFLEVGPRGAVGVDRRIASSWERSVSAGVSADRLDATYHDDLDLESRLVRCAQPVIERIGADIIDIPVVIALTDPESRILYRHDCSSAVGRVLDRVCFAPGFGYGEGDVGTNGVGTVFKSGSPVTVLGPEHYTERLHAFACTGAPVLDPVTGRAEGVLDISCLMETWSPLLQSIARSAAVDISRNLLLDRTPAQVALFEAYVRADARGNRAVMAVSGHTTMVNRGAQASFSAEELQVIREHASFMLIRHERGTTDTIELSPGRSVRIRSSGVSTGSECAGAVLVLEPSSHTSGVSPLRLPHMQPSKEIGRPDPDGAGCSPAWLRARAETANAVIRQENLLVFGEPGVGKVALLADLFRRVHPQGRVIAVDVRQSLETSSIERDGGPLMVVFRHLDRLERDSVGSLLGILDGPSRASISMVAATITGEEIALDHPAAPVLARFSRSVTLPPVRLRVEDLPLLIARELRDLAPHRQVRLSPAASRVLSSYHWPRNLHQLREALEIALRRRPVGEIQVEDLPGHCRTAPNRELSTIEAAERDAILAALRDCEGNRVLAAKALGMSRSSLYRKLRTYAIHAH